MSPVEQIALTVNIALRRDAMTVDYYQAGSAPELRTALSFSLVHPTRRPPIRW
jgi:hypothetical protein